MAPTCLGLLVFLWGLECSIAARSHTRAGMNSTHKRVGVTVGASADVDQNDEPDEPNQNEGHKDNVCFGTWDGYWRLNTGQKGEMHLKLNIDSDDNRLYGTGKDQVGKFTIDGHATVDSMHFVKHYIGKHSLDYKGKSVNGGKSFRGRWKILGQGYEEQPYTFRIAPPPGCLAAVKSSTDQDLDKCNGQRYTYISNIDRKCAEKFGAKSHWESAYMKRANKKRGCTTALHFCRGGHWFPDCCTKPTGPLNLATYCEMKGGAADHECNVQKKVGKIQEAMKKIPEVANLVTKATPKAKQVPKLAPAAAPAAPVIPPGSIIIPPGQLPPCAAAPAAAAAAPVSAPAAATDDDGDGDADQDAVAASPAAVQAATPAAAVAAAPALAPAAYMAPSPAAEPASAYLPEEPSKEELVDQLAELMKAIRDEVGSLAEWRDETKGHLVNPYSVANMQPALVRLVDGILAASQNIPDGEAMATLKAKPKPNKSSSANDDSADDDGDGDDDGAGDDEKPKKTKKSKLVGKIVSDDVIADDDNDDDAASAKDDGSGDGKGDDDADSGDDEDDDADDAAIEMQQNERIDMMMHFYVFNTSEIMGGAVNNIEHDVHPHGHRWWTYRYEYTFMECLFLLPLLWLFFFLQRLLRVFSNTSGVNIVAMAAYDRKTEDGKGNFARMYRYVAQPFLYNGCALMIIVFFLYGLYHGTNFFDWWADTVRDVWERCQDMKRDDPNQHCVLKSVPFEGYSYYVQIFRIVVKIFGGVLIYTVFVGELCRVFVHYIQYLEEIEEEDDGSLSHRSGSTADMKMYSLLQKNFCKRLEMSEVYKEELKAEAQDIGLHLDGEVTQEELNKVQFYRYIVAALDYSMQYLVFWGPSMFVGAFAWCVLAACAAFFLHLNFIWFVPPLLLFFFILLAIAVVLKTHLVKAITDENADPPLKFLSIKMWIGGFQLVVFLLSYSCSRLVFSESIWGEYPGFALAGVIGFLILSVLTWFFLADLMRDMVCMLSLPPNVEVEEARKFLKLMPKVESTPPSGRKLQPTTATPKAQV